MTTREQWEQARAARRARGAALAAAAAVTGSEFGEYLVNGHEVWVSGDGRFISCDCLDYQHRGHVLGTCKHCEAVRCDGAAHARVRRAQSSGSEGMDRLIARAVSLLSQEQDETARNVTRVVLGYAWSAQGQEEFEQVAEQVIGPNWRRVPEHLICDTCDRSGVWRHRVPLVEALQALGLAVTQ